ncbi:MAG: acyl carrier protein [Caldilineaceae bacterium]
MTREEILASLSRILQDTFDIDAARIVPEARLSQDLDIDSIDAVDMIVKLKPIVGKRLQPDAFKKVRTVDDVVSALQNLLQQPE